MRGGVQRRHSGQDVAQHGDERHGMQVRGIEKGGKGKHRCREHGGRGEHGGTSVLGTDLGSQHGGRELGGAVRHSPI